jgi:hypothetical protein
MKKLIIAIGLLGLSLIGKSQSLTYQLDTMQFQQYQYPNNIVAEGIIFGSPKPASGDSVNLGYFQPAQFFIQIKGCNNINFEYETSISVYCAFPVTNSTIPYVIGQVEQYISQNFH